MGRNRLNQSVSAGDGILISRCIDQNTNAGSPRPRLKGSSCWIAEALCLFVTLQCLLCPRHWYIFPAITQVEAVSISVYPAYNGKLRVKPTFQTKTQIYLRKNPIPKRKNKFVCSSVHTLGHYSDRFMPDFFILS